VSYPRARRTPEERHAARAAGLDRFGRPLPRAAGTNPRALREEQEAQPVGAPSVAKPAGAPRPDLTYRSHARLVPCPACGAPAGAECSGVSGQPRRSFHADRHARAIELGAPLAPRTGAASPTQSFPRQGVDVTRRAGEAGVRST
jgi:hypothetical protein